MDFWQTWRRRVEKKYKVVYKRGPSTLAMFFAGLALASWVSFLFLSGFPVVQYAYYRLKPVTSAKLAEVLKNAQATDQAVQEEIAPEEEPQIEDEGLPEKDISLPEGHYLSIPEIEVDTIIWEGPTEEYERILKRGVWRVPEMPLPTEGKPVILVAHRFGYLEWTNEYRRKNSFFNLPKLEEGDEIEVVWDQRRFKYRVDRVVEAEEIDDYESDLILYTCKFVVSPVRILVYATRVN